MSRRRCHPPTSHARQWGFAPAGIRFPQLLFPGWLALGLLLGLTCNVPPVLAQQNLIQINQAQLVNMVFQNSSNLDQARQQLDAGLAARVLILREIVGLQPDQQELLELAGQGDVVRFFRDFEELMANHAKTQFTNEEWQEFWRKTQPLRQRYQQGLHNQQSLFYKVVQLELREEQLHKVREYASQRGARHDRILAKIAIAMIEREIPLTIEQRETLLGWIHEQTEARPIAPNRLYYQVFDVMHRLDDVPAEKMQAVLLENEVAALKKILERARMYAQSARNARNQADDLGLF